MSADTAPDGSGADVVRQFMNHVNHGDIPGALRYVHPDVAVTEPASLPYGGNYTGHAGLTELMGKIRSTWAKWRETPNRYAENGGLVFRETTMTAVLRSSGTEIEMPFVEVFEVADGLITAIRPHYWDPGLLQRPGGHEETAQG
jgi:ketosteroid isomerase-like protein